MFVSKLLGDEEGEMLVDQDNGEFDNVQIDNNLEDNEYSIQK